MDQDIRAITLHRPWPYAIFSKDLGKNIENRSWECWLPKGSQLLIHSGKKWDESGAAFIRRFGYQIPGEAEHPCGIVGVVRFTGNTVKSDSPWFTGPIGWKLSNPIPLEPIECPGSQGLWVPHPSVFKKFQASLR